MRYDCKPYARSMAQCMALNHIGEELSRWSSQGIATLAASGVPVEQRGQMILRLLMSCAGAVVVATDDLQQQAVDVEGFGPFCDGHFRAVLDDLRPSRKGRQ